MPSNEGKPDQTDQVLGRELSSSNSKAPGQFTRLFFGSEPKRDLAPSPGDSNIDPTHNVTLYGDPNLEKLGNHCDSLNPDAPELFPSENSQSYIEDQKPAAPAQINTLSDLFANQNALNSPAALPAGTFTKLFGDAAIVRPAPVSQPASPETFSGIPTPMPDPVIGQVRSDTLLSNQSSGHQDLPVKALADEFGALPPASGNSQKATRLFSLEKSTSDWMTPLNGPSAFTQVINSSALRAAGEKDRNSAAASNNPPPPSQALSPQVPQPVIPSWPIGSVPAPMVQPPAYVQPQAVLPVMTPVAPSPAFSLPPTPLSAPPPSTAPPAASESKWITYLPLIIALNVLFFLAVLLVLFFALSR